MTTIEALYNKALDAMSGQERVRHASVLYDGVYASLAHQVRLAEPTLGDRQVRLRVARIMYLMDERTQALLDAAERQ